MIKIAPLAAAVAASVALLSTAAAASTQRTSASTNVAVTLGKPAEFHIGVPTSAPAGKITFNVKNAGKIVHEFTVIKTAKAAAKLPVSGGLASETGAKGGSEDVGAGASKSFSVTLPTGHYAVICNIAGHYVGGMRQDFTVR